MKYEDIDNVENQIINNDFTKREKKPSMGNPLSSPESVTGRSNTKHIIYGIA